MKSIENVKEEASNVSKASIHQLVCEAVSTIMKWRESTVQSWLLAISNLCREETEKLVKRGNRLSEVWREIEEADILKAASGLSHWEEEREEASTEKRQTSISARRLPMRREKEAFIISLLREEAAWHRNLWLEILYFDRYHSDGEAWCRWLFSERGLEGLMPEGYSLEVYTCLLLLSWLLWKLRGKFFL